MKMSISLFLISLLTFFMGIGVLDSQTGSPKSSSRSAKAEAATDDATILATLKAKFANAPSMKDAPVDITVKDGVVTLTGKVTNGRQKGTATRMSKAVPGVKSVENKLEVTNAGPVIPTRAKENKQ